MPLFTTAELSADGLDRDERRRQLRSGRITRVHRGVFSPARPDDPAARHRQLIDATLPLCAASSVVSHRSAAVLWGLPLVGAPPAAVELTRTDVNSGKRRGGVHLHVAGLDRSEVTRLDGIPVTTLARTVVDLGRRLSVGPAVILGDAALRAGLTPDDLDCSLELARKRRGIAAARRTCRFLDARSESPGESWSRVLMAAAGLPEPVLQYEVRDGSSRLIARTDFGWPELRTVGEFDGLVKYERLLAPGQRASDVVVAEKRREDAIRARGLTVVRWVWVDLADFDPVVRRLRRAFALSR